MEGALDLSAKPVAVVPLTNGYCSSESDTEVDLLQISQKTGRKRDSISEESDPETISKRAPVSTYAYNNIRSSPITVNQPCFPAQFPGQPLLNPGTTTKSSTPRPFKMYPMDPTATAMSAMFPMGMAANPALAMGAAAGLFPFGTAAAAGGFPAHPSLGLAMDSTVSPFNSPVTNYLQNKRRKIESRSSSPVNSSITKGNDKQNQPSDSSSIFLSNSTINDQYITDNGPIESYSERRRKNNEAAKRSRDSRRMKEEEIAIRAALLEQENLKLRAQVAVLKNETTQLHCMLYQL